MTAINPPPRKLPDIQDRALQSYLEKSRATLYLLWFRLTAGNVLAPTPPSSATDTGTAGTVAWDEDYIYVCTASNTWKRAAITTW